MKKHIAWSWKNERKLLVGVVIAALAVLAAWVFLIGPLWVAAGMLWYMTIFNLALLSWSLWNLYKGFVAASKYDPVLEFLLELRGVPKETNE